MRERERKKEKGSRKEEDTSAKEKRCVREGYHQTCPSESTELLCILINLHICSPSIDSTQCLQAPHGRPSHGCHSNCMPS